MALLVATAGSTPRGAGQPGGQADAAARSPPAGRRRAVPRARARALRPRRPRRRRPRRRRAPNRRRPPRPRPAPPSSLRVHVGTGAGTPTTTGPERDHDDPAAADDDHHDDRRRSSQPADRTQTQGYLDPPLQSSNGYGFTGTGAMEISVLWSGTTYLTMDGQLPERQSERRRDLGHGGVPRRRERELPGDGQRAVVGVGGAHLHDHDRPRRWIARTPRRVLRQGPRRRRLRHSPPCWPSRRSRPCSSWWSAIRSRAASGTPGGLFLATTLCVLAVAAWVAWAACCAQLVRAVVAHVRSGDVGARGDASVMDRIAARIAVGVIALTTLGAPLALPSGAGASTPTTSRTAGVSPTSVHTTTAFLRTLAAASHAVQPGDTSGASRRSAWPTAPTGRRSPHSTSGATWTVARGSSIPTTSGRGGTCASPAAAAADEKASPEGHPPCWHVALWRTPAGAGRARHGVPRLCGAGPARPDAAADRSFHR